MTLRLTGVSDTFRVPAGLAEIFFNQGASAGAVGPRETIVYAPMLAGSSATINTRYLLNSTGDAETYGGVGMPGARFAKEFFANGGGKLWGVFYTNPATGTAASLTVSPTGTTSTAAGTAHLVVAGEDCTYSFASGATLASICAGLMAAVNNRPGMPVVASGGTTSIILTALVLGVGGNVNIKVRHWIDGGAGITPGTGGDLTGGAGGTIPEATAIATAMAAVATTPNLYYHCVPTAIAAAEYGVATSAKTAMTARSQPNPGLRSVAICASRDTPTNLDTMCAALNYERVQVVWMENSERDCATLVGQIAAIRAKNENADSAYNFAGYGSQGQGDWDIPATYLDTDWPSSSEQDTAINHGYTPIASSGSSSYVVLSVNTRAKTVSYFDFRCTETHRVSVCDEFVARCLQIWGTWSAGKKLKDDQFLADGTVDPNQKLYAGTIVPSKTKSAIITKVLREMEAEQKLQHVDESVASATCVKSTVNSGRLEAQCDLWVIDHAHQFLMRVNEVSPG